MALARLSRLEYSKSGAGGPPCTAVTALQSSIYQDPARACYRWNMKFRSRTTRWLVVLAMASSIATMVAGGASAAAGRNCRPAEHAPNGHLDVAAKSAPPACCPCDGTCCDALSCCPSELPASAPALPPNPSRALERWDIVLAFLAAGQCVELSSATGGLLSHASDAALRPTDSLQARHVRLDV
jgi:hypothetical protein